MIAAGAIRTCEVPIRTVATSISDFISLVVRPQFGGFVLLLQPFTAIKFKPVKADN